MTDCARRRVKLYVLNEERQWDDRGTGHVSALISPITNGDKSEADTFVSLVVISENDGATLLESRIQPDTAYQKQQETLIVWSEGENSDLALSFQEKSGCDEIWARICNVQGKDPSVDITQELVDDIDDPDDSDITSPTGPYSFLPGNNNSGLSNLFELPPCELTKLGEMIEMFSNNSTLRTHREQLANCIISGGVFLQQLIEVFRRAEISLDMNALNQLHDLAKQLLSLNHPTLYNELFAPSILMDIIGMLEYTPNGRRPHREFLIESSCFQDICGIQDDELIEKIHQTYRVQYIQECCLSPPSPFDDNTLNYLTTYVQQNKSIISRQLLQNDSLMRKLFLQIYETGDTKSNSANDFIDENIKNNAKTNADFEISENGKLDNDSNTKSDSDQSRIVSKLGNKTRSSLNTNHKKHKYLVFFLRELCQMCYSLQPPDKDTYLHQLIQAGTNGFQNIHQSYQQFAHHIHPGVFSPSSINSTMLNGSISQNDSRQIQSSSLLGILKVLLCSNDNEIRHAALDILQILLETHVGIVREFMYREIVDSDNNLMFNLLLNQLLSDPDPEASHAMNVSLMARALIDPEAFLPNGFTQVSEKNEFVSFLLKRVMPFLMRPLINNTQNDIIKRDDYHTAHVMFYILDISSFAIESHSLAMKNFLTQRHLFSKIILLLKSQHSFLVLAVIRLLRRVLGLKDEFYNRSFIRYNVFSALINCFRSTEHRYNLVNSALLELFDFIHTESIICLIQELGNKGYLEELATSVNYVSTFRNLLDRYQVVTQTQRPFLVSNNSALMMSNGSSTSSFHSPQHQLLLPLSQRLPSSVCNVANSTNQIANHFPSSPINIDICSSFNILQRQIDVVPCPIDSIQTLSNHNQLTNNESSELHSYESLNYTSRLKRNLPLSSEEEEIWYENEDDEEFDEEEEMDDENEELTKTRSKSSLPSDQISKQNEFNLNSTSQVYFSSRKSKKENSNQSSVQSSVANPMSEDNRKRSLIHEIQTVNSDSENSNSDSENSNSDSNHHEKPLSEDLLLKKAKVDGSPLSFASLVDYSDEEDIDDDELLRQETPSTQTDVIN